MATASTKRNSIGNVMKQFIGVFILGLTIWVYASVYWKSSLTGQPVEFMTETVALMLMLSGVALGLGIIGWAWHNELKSRWAEQEEYRHNRRKKRK